MNKEKLEFTNLISTISPVLRSGVGLSLSDASIALLFNIYSQKQAIMFIKLNRQLKWSKEILKKPV